MSRAVSNGRLDLVRGRSDGRRSISSTPWSAPASRQTRRFRPPSPSAPCARRSLARLPSRREPRRRLRHDRGDRGRDHGRLSRRRGFSSAAARLFKPPIPISARGRSLTRCSRCARKGAGDGAGGPPRLFTVGSIVADIRLEVPHLPVAGRRCDRVMAESRRAAASTSCAPRHDRGSAASSPAGTATGPYGDRIRADSPRRRYVVHGRAPKATAAFASFWSSRTVSGPSSPALASRPVSPGGASRICRSRPATRFSPPATIWPIPSSDRHRRLDGEAPRTFGSWSIPDRWRPIFRTCPGARHASRLDLGDEPARSRAVAGTTDPDAVRASLRPGLRRAPRLSCATGGAAPGSPRGGKPRALPSPAVAASTPPARAIPIRA